MEHRYYFPLTPFDLNLPILPLDFTPNLTLRQSIKDEVTFVAKKYHDAAWSRPRKDGETPRAGGLDDFLHTTLENRANHNNDVWVLTNSCTLLFDEIFSAGATFCTTESFANGLAIRLSKSICPRLHRQAMKDLGTALVRLSLVKDKSIFLSRSLHSTEKVLNSDRTRS